MFIPELICCSRQLTVQEIRKAKPMSREAAIRWRQAIRTAIEADSTQEASNA